MKRLWIIALILICGCNKTGLSLSDLANPSKKREYPKGVAVIETQIFLKDKSRVEYYSSQKEVIHENEVMTLLIIQDTLKQGDYLSINLFSRSYNNEMVYKTICLNKNMLLSYDSCYSYSIQKFIQYLPAYLIEE